MRVRQRKPAGQPAQPARSGCSPTMAAVLGIAGLILVATVMAVAQASRHGNAPSLRASPGPGGAAGLPSTAASEVPERAPSVSPSSSPSPEPPVPSPSGSPSPKAEVTRAAAEFGVAAPGALGVKPQFDHEPTSMRFVSGAIAPDDVVTADRLVSLADVVVVKDEGERATVPEASGAPDDRVAVLEGADAAALGRIHRATVVSVVGSLTTDGSWLGPLRDAAEGGLRAVLLVRPAAAADEGVWGSFLRQYPRVHLYATGLGFRHPRAHLLPSGLRGPSSSSPAQDVAAWAGDGDGGGAAPDERPLSVLVAAPERPAWLPEAAEAGSVAAGATEAEAAAAMRRSGFVAGDWEEGAAEPGAVWAALYAGAVPVVPRSALARLLVDECPGLQVVFAGEDGAAPDLSAGRERLGWWRPRLHVPWLRLGWWRNRLAAHRDAAAAASAPLVWVHMGKAWPAHMAASVRQAGLWNPGRRRVVISNREFESQAPGADASGAVEFVAVEDVPRTGEWRDYADTPLEGNKEGFRDGFWRFTTERLMALHAWAVSSGTESLLHLENDNMLYEDAANLWPAAAAWGVGVWAGTVRAFRSEALVNFVVVHRTEALGRLVRGIAYDPPASQRADPNKKSYNEMQRVGVWLRHADADVVGVFPAGTLRDGWPGKVDEAGFGQWLGGNDPRNGANMAGQGFCNSWTYFPCGELEFSWARDEGAGRLAYPQWRARRPSMPHEAPFKMASLHVHHKARTQQLLSDLPDDKLLPISGLKETGRW